MNKHASESCPRCQTLFVCKVNSIRSCDCQQIELTPDELQYIRDLARLEYNDGCFCVTCLTALKAQSHAHFLTTIRDV
ncbi:cysteine-rich CWC family protein [Spirosoma utsteinense]|uniref:cysteine-rich CWC family protein n=1 Tax=Spirosoma utsteinense TaxID=2585773 RepID=UPI003742FF4D